MQLKEENEFNIAGADNGFTSRANDIFAALTAGNESNPHFRLPTGPARRATPGPSHSGSPSQRSRTDLRSDRRRRSSEPYHANVATTGGAGGTGGGGDSRTRRGTISRRHQTPDHRMHPERWTRHNLADVDITPDNRRIAFEFREAQTRRREGNASEGDASECEPTTPGDAVSTSNTTDTPECDAAGISAATISGVSPDSGESVEKLEFRRPSASRNNKIEPLDRIRSGFGNSKLVMPEYQVGVSKPKTQKPGKPTTDKSDCTKSSTISLGHLMDEEEEDDD